MWEGTHAIASTLPEVAAYMNTDALQYINEDLTPELRKNLVVHLVSTIDEVLALALQPVSTDVVRPTRRVTRSSGPVRPRA